MVKKDNQADDSEEPFVLKWQWRPEHHFEHKKKCDDAEKSPVSHTVLVHSKQYLHNKKRRPNREHQCGTGQIPSEGQVRTSRNSRVPKLG